MQKKYHIEGMTCGGCRLKVENTLNAIPEVLGAEVYLQDKEAVVTIEKMIDINVFKKALPKKYIITETENDVADAIESVNSITNKKNELAQLFPLFLIFGYITIASILLNYTSWDVASFMLDFMGLFYVVFSFFKMLDLRGFPKSFSMYDPLAKVIPVYGWVYPFIEVGLGIMLLMRFRIDIALIITILILGITTIGVTKTLIDKKSIQCACLGTALRLPMTKATFIENSIMLVMAIWMLIKIYF